MNFSQGETLLHIDTGSYFPGPTVIAVLNDHAETVHQVKLVSGEHDISLAALGNGEYSVRLSAGNNVWVNKIFIQHS